MRNICLTLVAAGTLFLLSACSDPYEREIPASGFVAAGEAEDIAGRLNDSDKDLFRRWAKRAPTNERFPGEAIPRSVRSALTNQTRFEALQAEKSAKDAEKIAAAQKMLATAFVLSETPPLSCPDVLGWVDADGFHTEAE